jgi:quinol-cytochrome oxidoreductase complex cytochrome b subunit
MSTVTEAPRTNGQHAPPPELQQQQAPPKSWLEQRFGLIAALRHEGEDIVPAHATKWPWFFLGSTLVLIFGIQVITGILLMFYYKPTVDEAYGSVKFIMTEVEFGWFVRSVHHWGNNLFVAVMLIHMARAFYTGAYKKPRELHWVSGMVLITLGMMFGFTGYLLPWDQIAYWATTVGTEMARSVPPPALGDWLLQFFRGGENVGGDTLTRFFALHVIVLPIVAAALIFAHLVMVRTTGLTNPVEK